MKKFISLLCAGVLALTSCSSDKNDTTPVASAKVILPTKAIVNFVGETPSVATITYNGDKIVQITYDYGDNAIYTYTGDLITKVVESSSKNISSTTDYVYENNKLKTSTTTEISSTGPFKSKIDYTHNADGTVEFKEYSINSVTGAETLGNTGKYTNKNGNTIKAEDQFSTTIMEYDTKNNPIKNIKGFDKLIDEGGSIAVNNVTKETRTVSFSGSGTIPVITTHEYIYNTDGYPTESKEFQDNVLKSTIQYFY